ncbi:hypothetical protein LQW54_001461 [Pestalotiopsis sp. IQ-011]
MVLADPRSLHATRSEFGAHAVWVTRYHDRELYATGMHTMQSPRGVDGLQSLIKSRSEGVRDEETVIWHTFGTTHNPRVEEWPVNFFTRNPAIDVASSNRSANKSVLVEDAQAWCYGNEIEVRDGIAQALASGVKREGLFVTTKLWCTYHSRVEENLDESLKSLGLDYVDLYLMHWPVAMNPNGNDPRFPRLADGSIDVVRGWSHIQTWKAMESLLASGKVNAIGVCDYSVKFLEELLAHASVTPAVNQIENHPSLPQQDVIDFCNANGIHVTAYSPLGSMGSPLMKEKAIADVPERLDRKVKCDTKAPCGQCTRRGEASECVYQEQRGPGGNQWRTSQRRSAVSPPSRRDSTEGWENGIAEPHPGDAAVDKDDARHPGSNDSSNVSTSR